jgi:hypothetical protein
VPLVVIHAAWDAAALIALSNGATGLATLLAGGAAILAVYGIALAARTPGRRPVDGAPV